MALKNYAQQKGVIRKMAEAVEELNTYADTLNAFAQELNVCWASNDDKTAVFKSIQLQMDDVNNLRQNANWVYRTADWALEKINELGSLKGQTPPHIKKIPDITVLGAATSNTIQVDTGRLRSAAEGFQAKRALLVSIETQITQMERGLDSLLVSIVSLFRLLPCVSKAKSLVTRHDRLAAGVLRVADIYDGVDKSIYGMAVALAKNAAQAVTGAAESAMDYVKLKQFTEWALDESNWTVGGSWLDGKWIVGATGKGGVHADTVFGAQCADISKAWVQKLLGLDSPPPLSAWNNKATAPMVNFDWQGYGLRDASGGPYKAGDVGFTSGHTYVIITDQDADGYVTILEQNARPAGNPDGSPQTSQMHYSKIENAYRK